MEINAILTRLEKPSGKKPNPSFLRRQESHAYFNTPQQIPAFAGMTDEAE
ncbi:MAG: hypothetical protein ACR2P5_01905 [Gammaproteobacteria bacterium]